MGGTFGFTIRTTNGRTYDFQKSEALREGSWYTIQTIWGDGSDIPVTDPNAAGESGFYRVMPRCPGCPADKQPDRQPPGALPVRNGLMRPPPVRRRTSRPRSCPG